MGIIRSVTLIILFILLYTNTTAQGFDQTMCKNTSLDSFDIRISYRLINGQLDTVNQKLRKNYSAFMPCRLNIYRAIYTDKKGVEISNELIKTLATGNRWRHLSNIQNELLINYEAKEENEQIRLRNLSINSTYSGSWKGVVSTGVIENEVQVWMHPFRSNQYIFTEVAPFPEIQLPVEIGKKWSSETQIMEGWGDWTNTKWKHKYKIVERGTRNYPFGSLDDCIRVIAVSSNKKFGKSKLDLWYHNEYGFIEFNYQNYQGQKLSILLESIEMKNP